MSIFLASDHAGVNHKHHLQTFLREYSPTSSIVDIGPYNTDSVHYPHYAQLLCHKVLETPGALGILICGTGIGMSIAANRMKGIRAALCHDEMTIIFSKKHNNANVLCLGAKIVAVENMKKWVPLWIETSFEGGRHQERLDLIDC